jgi:hypothetical protein
MYLIIRCPGCRTFMYVDRYQKWKLCPACGESINCSKTPIYIEVDNHSDAEIIVSQLEEYLHKTGKKDLSPSELEKLNVQYAQWLRNKKD